MTFGNLRKLYPKESERMWLRYESICEPIPSDIERILSYSGIVSTAKCSLYETPKMCVLVSDEIGKDEIGLFFTAANAAFPKIELKIKADSMKQKVQFVIEKLAGVIGLGVTVTKIHKFRSSKSVKELVKSARTGELAVDLELTDAMLKVIRQREHVVSEIIETEKTYLEDIK